jgi:hypothetical protein
MGIIFKIMNEFYAKNEFIMNFWNDGTMYFTHKMWKMWIQKIFHSIDKIKIKKYSTIKWEI